MDNHQRHFTLALLAHAVQRNIAPDYLCRLANLDLHALNVGADLQVTHKQINDLWINAVHLSHDELFGLHLGESMQLSALGIVGELVKTSRTIGEGITHAAEYGNLLTDAFQILVNKSSRTFNISFVPNERVRNEYPHKFKHMIDLSMVMTIHELDGLVLKKITPLNVSLPFGDSQRLEYARTLRCMPKFAEEYRMEFDSALWDEHIISANYELQVALLKFAHAALDKLKEQTQQSLNQKVSQYLITNSYLGIPAMDEIASNFNMSSRTFQRRLQDEGITYQDISDGIRKHLALNYVESGRYQLKEISAMLGYNELSAFARAFKRWTGNSPARYQQELNS